MQIRVKAGLVVLVGVIVWLLLIVKMPDINGPWFFPWAWRKLPAAPVYLSIALASIPMIAAQFLDLHRTSTRYIALCLIMLGSFAARFASAVVHTTPPSLILIPAIVEDPKCTSYYTDAAALSNYPLRQWMPLYPQLMQTMSLHSQNKPPGPISYWLLFMHFMGVNHNIALTGGIVLGVIATLAIPATFLCLQSVLNDSDAAFCGATFLAFCPGFVLFYPMCDPAFILLTAGLIGLWHNALTRNYWVWAILMGLLLAAIMFITFNVLVLGLFLVAMIFIPSERPLSQRLVVSLKQGSIALIVAAAILFILWFTIQYDPIQTFLSALRNQHALLTLHKSERPYPWTILFDLTDFAFGSAWISVLLVGFYFARRDGDRYQWLALIAIGQLVVIAVFGIMQTETARVWNFMLPLLMIPVGMELARWPRSARIVCYATLAFVTAAICQNVKFIY